MGSQQMNGAQKMIAVVIERFWTEIGKEIRFVGHKKPKIKWLTVDERQHYEHTKHCDPFVNFVNV